MEEDPAVSRSILAASPGQVSPAELADEAVIGVFLFRDEAAVGSFTGNADGRGTVDRIDDGKHTLRVLVFFVFDVRVEAFELRLVREENDRLGGGHRRLRCRNVQQRAEESQKDAEPAAE